MPTKLTLSACLEYLAGELRDIGLNAGHDDVKITLRHAVNNAQQTLDMMAEWPELRSRATVATVANQQRYAIPPDVDVHRISRVLSQWGGDIRELLHQLDNRDVGSTPYVADPASRWWIDGVDASKPLVLWPTPQTADQTILIDYYKSIPDLTLDTDETTLDGRLVCMLAAAEIAKARGLLDAEEKARKFQVYFDSYKARMLPQSASFYMGRAQRVDWRDLWQPRVPL